MRAAGYARAALIALAIGALTGWLTGLLIADALLTPHERQPRPAATMPADAVATVFPRPGRPDLGAS
jgi:hypothetical protein